MRHSSWAELLEFKVPFVEGVLLAGEAADFRKGELGERLIRLPGLAQGGFESVERAV